MKLPTNLTTVIITSRRLCLRPVSLKYKRDIFREFTPEITKYMIPQPAKHISETEKFIRDSRVCMKQGRKIVFVILKNTTQEFLGCAGLHKINTLRPELGIWLKKSAHGHRYGREAMTLIKKWVDDHLLYEYILYPVGEHNIASRKIPESLGGKLVSKFIGKNVFGTPFEEVEYRIYPK